MITTISPAVSASASADAWGVIVFILLIMLLIAKELASALHIPRAQRFNSTLTITTVPLLLALAAIVASKLLAILA